MIKPFYNRLHKKKYFLSLVFALFAIKGQCQENTSVPEQKSDFWKNVQFGIGGGLNFGSGFFSGQITPNAIYQVSEQVGIGLGASASYNRLKNNYNATTFGGSIISTYSPFKTIQASLEFEQLHSRYTFEDQQKKQYWIPALYTGIGFRTANAVIGIRYNLLFDKQKSASIEPYTPFIRVFF